MDKKLFIEVIKQLRQIEERRDYARRNRHGYDHI